MEWAQWQRLASAVPIDVALAILNQVFNQQITRDSLAEDAAEGAPINGELIDIFAYIRWRLIESTKDCA